MDKEKRDSRSGGMARSRAKRTGRSKTLPFSRPILIALVLIFAGAIFLFWPRGSSAPSGIGERSTVVTAQNDVNTNSLGTGPRSGDVAIQDEVQSIVPEEQSESQTQAQTQNTGETSPTKAASQESSSQPDKPAPATKQSSQPTAEQPAEKSTEPTKPQSVQSTQEKSTKTTTTQTPRSARKEPEKVEPAPRLMPASAGGWAVQLGAFSQEENATKLINKLQQKGYPASLHTINTSTGDFLYKVWIGYFKSRDDAATFGKQHRKQIGDAIPVHR